MDFRGVIIILGKVGEVRGEKVPIPFICTDLSQVVYNSKNCKELKCSPTEDTLYKSQYMKGGLRHTIGLRHIKK